MSGRDYYAMLGVSRDADSAALKAAYRKLAMQYHPDRNPGNTEAEARFKEVSEAYDVLRDPQKRAAYDRFGHEAYTTRGAAGGGDGAGMGGFADIFEEMFGDVMGGRGQGRQNHGADLRYDLEISLEDAFHGRSVTIKVPSSAPCGDCGGSGARAGTSPRPCTSCNGRGKVRMQQGFFSIERTCPDCRGHGATIDHPCTACHGNGRRQEVRTLSVNIPQGVEDGARIRLRGEGEAGVRGAPAGDLYIFLTVSRHPIFRRDGVHVACEVPVPMVDAALGSDVEVPTIDGGRAKVRIPEGAQNGQRFRLRGKGMTALRGRSRGDMFIELRIETPVNLTREQKKLLESFRTQGAGSKQNPETDGFFSRVREFWDGLTE